MPHEALAWPEALAEAAEDRQTIRELVKSVNEVTTSVKILAERIEPIVDLRKEMDEVKRWQATRDGRDKAIAAAIGAVALLFGLLELIGNHWKP